MNEHLELPQDPAMLMSYINTLLRDFYSIGGLDELCASRGIDRGRLEEKLAKAGFEYNPIQNRFW